MLILPIRFAVDLPAAVAKAELENPLSSPPSLNMIKAYLMWRVKVARARLQESKAIAQSIVKKELEQLLRIVKLSTKHEYNKKQTTELKQVC